jgi:hypothetical protein
MAACGFTTDFLYERLKAAEEEGSEAASQLMQDFLLLQEGEPEAAQGGEHQEAKTVTQGKGKRG